MAAYSVGNPVAVVPFLLQGLGLIREAAQLSEGHDDALFLLTIKERQFQDAINTALGLQFRAVSAPLDSGDPISPFSQPATMGVVVPGQQFQVDVSLVNPSSLSIRTERISLGKRRGLGDRGGFAIGQVVAIRGIARGQVRGHDA